jgi:hypothetical protein
MKEREKYENGLLTVRFIGEDLKGRGVSIYDLSTSLLAIQRIVHKAHLSLEDRLLKGAFPNIEERQHLALQIGERRRTSDAFALVSVLANPEVREYLAKIVDYIFGGIVGYYTGDVLKRLSRETDQNKRIFIGSIYTEVVNIANRVDASGGVEAISLGAPVLQKDTIAAFDQDAKHYLKSLENQYYLGDYQEIKGQVYKLYPTSKIVAIRRGGGRNVSIHLSEADFDKIRYHQETSPTFIFKGRPRYQFGVETKVVTEFMADAITHVNNKV